MTTVLEIHAIQNVPPANINRDDTGAPKTATYGGVLRGRVSSQAWKHAMRKDFIQRLDPTEVGYRTKQVIQLIMDAVVARDASLTERAEELATWALNAAGIKTNKPRAKEGRPERPAEVGYLLFVSHQQVQAVADAIVAHADEPDEMAFKAALTQSEIKKLLDTNHSIDIALFGRMVADAPDLNVDAACQVAHAVGVHEVVPEYDYYTAVDDVTEANEESGAGMIGTVEFYSSTFYRYAALSLDQLATNLGSADATRRAVEQFVRSFIDSMPSGKQNTFANGTRPSAVMITVGQGQSTSLVGAFEEPITQSVGYVTEAVKRLASHAAQMFTTWRQPDQVWVCGLPDVTTALQDLGTPVSYDELVTRAGGAVK